ncbi:MAG: exopolysaccharide biosynthesis protein [Phycisphaerae bacterium]
MSASPSDVARPPRGIRLALLLAELARNESVHQPPPPTLVTGTSAGGASTTPPAAERAYITIGQVIDRAGESGFGFLFGLMALITLPLPGVSMPFSVAISIGAVQMTAGLHRPWLPRWIRARRLPVAKIAWLSVRLSRWTAGLERIIRPRLHVLTRGPFWIACGVGVLVQALLLALPLPIPGSNWPFILVLVLYAIGLLELDGLLLTICHGLTAAYIVLTIVFFDALVAAVHKAFAWAMAML